MVQQISEYFRQAEARSEETKKFIQDIERATRRRFSAEEKIAIVPEGFRRAECAANDSVTLATKPTCEDRW
jgi:hypothetical protein